MKRIKLNVSLTLNVLGGDKKQVGQAMQDDAIRHRIYLYRLVGILQLAAAWTFVPFGLLGIFTGNACYVWALLCSFVTWCFCDLASVSLSARLNRLLAPDHLSL